MRANLESNPIRFLLCVLLVVLAAMAFARQAVSDELTGPEITAQGFDIAVPRTGELGKFGRIRVRIEAPERIATLSITERSYEVDLATTLDKVNYRLFGIERRVRRYQSSDGGGSIRA